MLQMIGKMKIQRIFGGVRALAVLAIFVGCLLAWTGCAPKKPKPAPPPTPSTVVTKDGMSFAVTGLRIPGTRQDLKLKLGDSLAWVPLDKVAVVRFTGPINEAYRPAVIYLDDGDKIIGEVYVDFLIEGSTDLGYWNMPMRKVESLELGFD
jgi:hypothetical protein